MRTLRVRVLALFVMTGVILGGCALQQNALEKRSVVVSHLPVEGERLSADYVVEVNGQDVPVYTSAVSPDVQEAPLNLNELYSFAGFECSGVVEVTIRSADPLTELSVRSVHQRVPVKLNGNTAVFKLEQNGNYLIELSTRNVRFKYTVDHKQALHLESVGSVDGKWVSPLAGPLFSPTPCHLGNGPRYLSPRSIITDDISNGIELVHQSHELDQSQADVAHLTITVRDKLHPVTVELHQKAYVNEDTIEQWMVLKNGMDTPLKVDFMACARSFALMFR